MCDPAQPTTVVPNAALRIYSQVEEEEEEDAPTTANASPSRPHHVARLTQRKRNQMNDREQETDPLMD